MAALQTTAARSREAFLRHVSKQNCISCHQQYLSMAAVGHARNRSIRFDQEAAREQIDVLVNGDVELRKRRQMKAGDIVSIEDGSTIELRGGD